MAKNKPEIYALTEYGLLTIKLAAVTFYIYNQMDNFSHASLR